MTSLRKVLSLSLMGLMLATAVAPTFASPQGKKGSKKGGKKGGNGKAGKKGGRGGSQ
jgi:hypothetical protein